MGEFTIKDSGERRVFSTGAVRDVDDDKPRPDLIPHFAEYRLGAHYGKGARKYDPRNWEKGQPVSVLMASLQRHLLQYKMGDREEDHLAAVAFGILGIMEFEERAKRGDTVALEMLDAYASKELADQIRKEAKKDADETKKEAKRGTIFGKEIA